MASRLASRLKGSSKKSPGPSQPSTPTHSQSNMNVTKQEEPSIDEVLTGPDIESLRIDEEVLKKLHDSVLYSSTSIDSQGQLHPVVVIKDPHSLKPSNKKSVAVLYPLPTGIKPRKTKLLGSSEAGPRCDEDEMFMSHTILGTVEEYAVADHASSKPFNVSRTQPKVLPPSPPNLHKKMTEKNISPRQANALMNWDKRMEDRKLLQEKIKKRISSSRQLVMNHGDFYRQTQEQRSVIDRAIPSVDKGKGYFAGGSEFWTPQTRIGDDLTGISLTLTKTERGCPPDIEMVKIPKIVRKTQGLQSIQDVRYPSHHNWRESKYLMSRKSELKNVIQDIGFSPSTELPMLHVMGHSPKPDDCPHTTSTTSYLLNSGSLDSLGEEHSQEDEEEEDSLLQSTSIFNLHPDVTTRPLMRPALKLNNKLLKWEGGETRTSCASQGTKGSYNDDDNDIINIRVLFETGVKQPVTSILQFQNVGTTSVYYNWKRVTKPNPLGTALPGKTQRFYFDMKAGVLSPGQCLSLSIIFKSCSPGIYSEKWCIETRPVLCNGRQITVTMRGVAFQPDANETKRQKLEEYLTNKVAEVTTRRLVNTILDTIQTPPRVISPLPLTITEEDEFLSKNTRFYYNYDIVSMLRRLYIEIKSPLSLTKPQISDVSVTKMTATTKKTDEKTKKGGKEKKDGGGGGGGKGVAKGGATITNQQSREDIAKDTTNNQDNIIDANIIPWDLSIDSLQETILQIEDDERREELLVRLNTAIMSLSVHPPVVRKPTSYTIMYSILCDAIDDITEHSNNLRLVMGLPLKELGLKTDEETADQDTIQPSQSAESPVHGGKKEQGGRKGKGKDKDSSKDKERPSSKQKGKIVRKGSFKAAAKTVMALSKPTSPETTAEKPVLQEIDQILESKYKQNFYSLAYYILKSSIHQADELLATL